MPADPTDKWVEEYFSTPEKNKDDLVVRIVKDMLNQSGSMLGITRRLTTRIGDEAALCAILNELDNRWRRFSRKVETKIGRQEVKPDGFVRFLEAELSESFQGWMGIRQKIGLPAL